MVTAPSSFELQGQRILVQGWAESAHGYHYQGRLLDNYLVVRELGRGANGVVFLVRNELLDRTEALKIWSQLRTRDKRDKIAQGIAEARKTHNAYGEVVPAIYHAEIVAGVFFVTMEFVEGILLKNLLLLPLTDVQRYQLAWAYLRAIMATTRNGTFHGDAHSANVMVQMDTLDAPGGVTLLDFGTSIFFGQERAEARHWQVVHETIISILGETGKSEQFDRIHRTPFKERLGAYTSLLTIWRDRRHF
jgi:serine/threonine protein kinase